MFLKLGTAGWYVVTKGRIFPALSLFVKVPTSFHWIWLRTLFFLLDCCGSLSHRGVFWIGWCSQQKISLTNPLINPFLTPNGWQEEKWVYWNVSVALKCVRISRIACYCWIFRLWKQSVVSRKLISLSEISAVNLIVGWWLFARTTNSSISFLSTFHSENMSSMYLFHSSDRRVKNICTYCLTKPWHYAKPDQCLSLTYIYQIYRNLRN